MTTHNNDLTDSPSEVFVGEEPLWSVKDPNRFLSRLTKSIIDTLVRRGLTLDDSEDFAQGVMEKGFERFPQICDPHFSDKDREYFIRFSFTVARRRWIDRLRKKVESPVCIDDERDHPSLGTSPIDNSGVTIVVQKIIDYMKTSLSSRDCQIAMMFFFEKRREPEIALELGMSLTAVSNRVYIVRKNLRAALRAEKLVWVTTKTDERGTSIKSWSLL